VFEWPLNSFEFSLEDIVNPEMKFLLQYQYQSGCHYRHMRDLLVKMHRHEIHDLTDHFKVFQWL